MLINIENEVRAELNHLVDIQQEITKGSAEAHALQVRLQPLTVTQENIIKQEIETLKTLIAKLRTEDSPGSSTDLTIERAKLTIFALLAAWQKNIEHQKLLGMDIKTSTEQLTRIVQFVAIAQTGRIQISIDTINELNDMLALVGIDNQKQINAQLARLE